MLIPYVTFTVVTDAFIDLLALIQKKPFSIQKQVIGMVLQIRNSDYSGGVWFLTWIFVAQLLMQLILSCFKSEKVRNIVCVLSFAFGAVLINSLHISCLPWHLDAALLAVLFLRTGMLYRKYENRIKPRAIIIVCLVGGPLYVVLQYINTTLFCKQGIDVHDARIGNALLFAVCGIVGGICIIEAIKGLEQSGFFEPNGKRLLLLIGENSLMVYGWHMITGPIFYQVFTRLLPLKSNNTLSIVADIGIYALTLTSALAMALVCRKCVPKLFGCEPKIKYKCDI